MGMHLCASHPHSNSFFIYIFGRIYPSILYYLYVPFLLYLILVAKKTENYINPLAYLGCANGVVRKPENL